MTRSPTHNTRRAGGFFLLDAVVGLTILMAIAALFSVTLQRVDRHSRMLLDQRQLVTEAQAVLVDLQLGQAGRWAGELNRSVFIEIADEREPVGDRRWVGVRVERGGRSATLRGLVPIAELMRLTAPPPEDAP